MHKAFTGEKMQICAQIMIFCAFSRFVLIQSFKNKYRRRVARSRARGIFITFTSFLLLFSIHLLKNGATWT